jgi:hypothetical protein
MRFLASATSYKLAHLIVFINPAYKFKEESLAAFAESPKYNLEVEDFHTYFVGELGVWVQV